LTSPNLPACFDPTCDYPLLDGSGDLEADLWLRPNPDLTDVHDVLRYAITVDGYAYAREVLGRDLFEMSDELERRCSGRRRAEASLVELRLHLFFVQRALRHMGQDSAHLMGADRARELLDLNHALCSAWERGWPEHLGLAPRR
jgi:hypothetical protein